MTAAKLASFAVLAAGVLFLTTGCDQLTRAHFDMIEVGHAERFDVEKTIGDPSYQLDDQWHYERVDKHLNVMVHFNDQGRVERKEWHDVLNNVHYDSAKLSDESGTYEGTEIRTINE